MLRGHMQREGYHQPCARCSEASVNHRQHGVDNGHPRAYAGSPWRVRTVS